MDYFQALSNTLKGDQLFPGLLSDSLKGAFTLSIKKKETSQNVCIKLILWSSNWYQVSALKGLLTSDQVLILDVSVHMSSLMLLVGDRKSVV